MIAGFCLGDGAQGRWTGWAMFEMCSVSSEWGGSTYFESIQEESSNDVCVCVQARRLVESRLQMFMMGKAVFLLMVPRYNTPSEEDLRMMGAFDSHLEKRGGMSSGKQDLDRPHTVMEGTGWAISESQHILGNMDSLNHLNVQHTRIFLRCCVQERWCLGKLLSTHTRRRHSSWRIAGF